MVEAGSSTTLFSIKPNSDIEILIKSPCFRNLPSTTPTPPGVPVKIKSPGSRVKAIKDKVFSIRRLSYFSINLSRKI